MYASCLNESAHDWCRAIWAAFTSARCLQMRGWLGITGALAARSTLLKTMRCSGVTSVLLPFHQAIADKWAAQACDESMSTQTMIELVRVRSRSLRYPACAHVTLLRPLASSSVALRLWTLTVRLDMCCASAQSVQQSCSRLLSTTLL